MPTRNTPHLQYKTTENGILQVIPQLSGAISQCWVTVELRGDPYIGCCR